MLTQLDLGIQALMFSHLFGFSSRLHADGRMPCSNKAMIKANIVVCAGYTETAAAARRVFIGGAPTIQPWLAAAISGVAGTFNHYPVPRRDDKII